MYAALAYLVVMWALFEFRTRVMSFPLGTRAGACETPQLIGCWTSISRAE
jgi:hypothetical protein